MRVAIYTIALNEEQFVERWYQSAKDADYLLIADTGSTDKTVEIAKSLGINVVDISVSPWRFDDARNAALSHIPLDIDYCISLDMDEIVTPNWKEALEKAFEKGITRPKYKHIWSWNADGSPGMEFAYDHIHARKGYRWKHPVHEILQPYGIQEVSEFIDGIETHHHPDPTKSRSQYLPLLKMAVDEDPYDDRNAHYYARELFFYGLTKQAKKEFLRHLSLPRATWKPERAASMRYIAKCSDGGEREHWLLKAVEEAPNRRESLVDLAKFYYENQQWLKCLEYAKQALAITEKPLEYLCEEEAWNDMPYDLAAISSYNLEKYEDAAKYGMEALKLNPQDRRLQSNFVFYSSKLQNK